MSDDDVLKEALEAFEQVQEAEADNRREAAYDLRFARNDEQWPETIRRDRELNNRPCLTINKLPPIIRQVVNDARQNKPAISVHPVDSASDPLVAEVYNGLIRHIEQSSNAEVAYDTALDYAATMGFGYFRINTAYSSDDTFDQDIVIQRVADPLSIYGDPDSTAADSSDWNTAFVTETMAKATFERRFKGADPVDWEMDYAKLGGPWVDGERVMLAEWWTREEVSRRIVMLSDGQVLDEDAYAAQKAMFDAVGVQVVGSPRDVASHKVMQRLLTGADVLETREWGGKYIPIVPVYGEEVFIEGRRHLRGLVRGARDAQRSFNYWRTASTEGVALAPLAPWVGPAGSFDTDATKWATANRQPHAYIEYDIVRDPETRTPLPPPQRQGLASIPAGALQEAANASDDLKAITGIYDASLGARSNETSGRAIMARQREGDVSTFHFLDNQSRAIRHAGRIILDLIPKVYNSPRILRVLGPDGAPGMVPVNQAAPVPAPGPGGVTQVVPKVFDLTIGKYDLTVKSGPSYTSRREEAASQMIELIRAYPAAAPVIGDLLAKNLDWPGADEVARRLQLLLPPQAQGGAEGPQMEEAKQAIEKLGQALKETQEKLASVEADKAVEMRKLSIEQFKAETDRLEAVARTGGALPPQGF